MTDKPPFGPLWRQLLVEVRHRTTSELVLTAALAAGAYAYKHFYGGGLSTEDMFTLVVPAVWVSCGFGFYCIWVAARHLRLSELAEWEADEPRIHGAPKRKRPSLFPVVLQASMPAAFVFGVFLLSVWGTRPAHRNWAITVKDLEQDDDARIQPTLVIDAVVNGEIENFENEFEYHIILENHCCPAKISHWPITGGESIA